VRQRQRQHFIPAAGSVPAEINENPVSGTSFVRQTLDLGKDSGLDGLFINERSDIFLLKIILRRKHSGKRRHIIGRPLQRPLPVFADTYQQGVIFSHGGHGDAAGQPEQYRPQGYVFVSSNHWFKPIPNQDEIEFIEN
jgi:hypothetical protein